MKILALLFAAWLARRRARQQTRNCHWTLNRS
jgi:hypothetical protein